MREFPGQRCLAIESRGHGRSSKPDPPCHWNAFTHDLLGIVEQLSISGAIGVGHSMGGYTLVAAAAARPQAFAGLVLADPTIRPPEAYETPTMDVSFVRKRRVQWSSPDEMFEAFRGRPPFNRWEANVLRDYCEFGLLHEGNWCVLACPPEIEASVYECSKEPETRLHAVIPSVAVPVVVLRAGFATDLPFSNSPTDPHLASRLPNGTDVLLREHTHFIPMEAPGLVAEWIRRMLATLAPA